MYKVFKNDIYPFCLVVGELEDVDEINKEYEDYNREDIRPHRTAEASTYPAYRKGTNYSAVCVLFNVKPTIRLIAHESLHVTHLVLDVLCHVPLSDATDECYAYLIGWIAEKLDEYQKD